jgi:Carbohydrate esterase, sialic acid-specific acetylesterase
MHYLRLISALFLALVYYCTPAVDDLIPRPDGKPADMSKPVQVFVMMGQSNMIGFGKIADDGTSGNLVAVIRDKKKYLYLVDDANKWTERLDVRNVRVQVGKTGMDVFNNDWLNIAKTKTIGVEFGVGHLVGNAVEAPVMLLKSCIGNRSLGWDLLPPGSVRFEADGKIYAGYKDYALSWAIGTQPPTSGSWYAGKQYDDDTANAKTVLNNLATYYPSAIKYEVAGFFWWQGEKDVGDSVHSAHYEKNLVQLIKQLRKDYNSPNAKFVLATLGEAVKGSSGNGGKVLEAHLAVDGESGKYPEFKGNVATVYSNPLSQGGSGNSHYNGNAETYMDVGEAMGQAMVKLLMPSTPPPVLSTVTTTTVTSITASGAVSGGNVTATGSAPVTARGVCWATTMNPTIANNKTTDGKDGGIFSSTITGLTAGTTYHVRAYATNSVGTAYGAQESFTTTGTTPVAPTVTTTTVTNITATGAVSGGNVTATGSAPVTARGVCWATTTNPTIANSKTTDGKDGGIFSSTITGLTAGTTYYVRAYATSSAGTSYGSPVSFNTSSAGGETGGGSSGSSGGGSCGLGAVTAMLLLTLMALWARKP